MKPLKELDNHSRAGLLFDLFPEHRQPLLDFIQKGAATLRDNKEECEKDWAKNMFVSFETWCNLAKKVDEAINENSKTITKKKGVFCDQLFDGYLSIFSGSAVSQYAANLTDEVDKDFKAIAKSLFG